MEYFYSVLFLNECMFIGDNNDKERIYGSGKRKKDNYFRGYGWY